MYKLLPLLVLLACKQASSTIENTQVQASTENAEATTTTENVETSAIGVSKKEIENPKAKIEKIFQELLPSISGGRKLLSSNTVLGDLNRDKRIDGILIYTLEPSLADNGGGGNAIGSIKGSLVFLNKEEKIIMATNSSSAASNDYFDGIVDNSYTLKSINNGVIALEGLEYADSDPRCCPSIKKTTTLPDDFPTMFIINFYSTR